MPLPKKIIPGLIIIIFIISFFPGCLEGIFGGTSFKLNAYSIVDDDGFPSIYMEFSANDKVTLLMLKPDGSLIDSEYYYSDIQSTLKIGEYRQTIQIGSYILKILDKKDELVKKENIETITKQGGFITLDQAGDVIKDKFYKLLVENVRFKEFLRDSIAPPKHLAAPPKYPAPTTSPEDQFSSLFVLDKFRKMYEEVQQNPEKLAKYLSEIFLAEPQTPRGTIKKKGSVEEKLKGP